MFSKLKNKLKNWTNSFGKKSEESPEESKKEFEKKPNKQKKESKENKTKEIEVPQKFSLGKLKSEPDLEKIKELEKKLKKESKEKTPEKEPEKKQKKSFFKKISSGKTKITEKEFEKYSEELETLLIENNVAFEVVGKILENIKQEITEKEIQKKDLEKTIKDSLKNSIEEILVEPFDLIEKIKNSEKPYVILFCGINGTGKTTTIAKFAHLLKQKNISCVLAGADTFRAASIEQIKQHSEKLEIKVITHEYGSDPASVGFDAVKYAEKNKIDCVLIDTAGRMYTEKNLMKEIEKISKVTNPNTKIFVGESTTGNDSVDQVNAFNESIGINGIILSKADVDEKGGTALSVGFTTGKPILFLGTGQKYNDLEPFDKKKFIEKLGLDN